MTLLDDRSGSPVTDRGAPLIDRERVAFLDLAAQHDEIDEEVERGFDADHPRHGLRRRR